MLVVHIQSRCGDMSFHDEAKIVVEVHKHVGDSWIGVNHISWNDSRRYFNISLDVGELIGQQTPDITRWQLWKY